METDMQSCFAGDCGKELVNESGSCGPVQPHIYTHQTKNDLPLNNKNVDGFKPTVVTTDVENSKNAHKSNFEYGIKNYKVKVLHVPVATKDAATNTREIINCSYCCFTTTSDEKMEIHQIKHLEKPPYYQCTHSGCRGVFTNRTLFVSHVKREHPGKPMFQCSDCEYSCQAQSRFKRHLIKHTNDQIYMCDHCSWTTKSSCSLKKHLHTHSGIEYSCSQCSFVTKRRRYLLRHSKNHSDARPYKCTYCDYTCKRQTYLETHMRRHTGDKQHTCPHCDFRSIQRTNMMNHIKKRHPHLSRQQTSQ